MEALFFGIFQYLGVLWLENAGFITNATESFFVRLYVMLSTLFFLV